MGVAHEDLGFLKGVEDGVREPAVAEVELVVTKRVGHVQRAGRVALEDADLVPHVVGLEREDNVAGPMVAHPDHAAVEVGDHVSPHEVVVGVEVHTALAPGGHRGRGQTDKKKTDSRDHTAKVATDSATFQAWVRSLTKSLGCSKPMDSLTKPSVMPVRAFTSAGTPAWVMLAGCSARLSVDPRLTANLKT